MDNCQWIEQVTIRYLTEDDLPSLEWDGEYTHFRRLYAEIFQSAKRGNAVLWVAEMKEVGVIGQLFVQLVSGRRELADGQFRAYVYGFRVQPAFRGCGVGTRLMHTAEADLLKRGFRWVTLNVGRDNPEARRLYETRGYRVVADEPGQWSFRDHLGKRHQVNEPAWRMEKKLVNHSVSGV